MTGPFVIGLSPDVRDTQGRALELGPPYIRIGVQDDIPPQITGTWVGLPESSIWQTGRRNSTSHRFPIIRMGRQTGS